MAGHLCRLNFANERTESPRGKRLWVNYLESYISYLLIYAYLFSPVILPDTPVIPFTLRWAGNDSTNTCNRHKSWEPRAHQSYTSSQSTSSSPRPSSGSHLHRDAAVKFPNTAPPLQHDEESSTSNSQEHTVSGHLNGDLQGPCAFQSQIIRGVGSGIHILKRQQQHGQLPSTQARKDLRGTRKGTW